MADPVTIGTLVFTGVRAIAAIPTALESLLSLRTTDSRLVGRVAKLRRRLFVTAIDKLLRDLMERTGEKYNFFMGTLDAMSDNLVAEALAAGMDAERIAHAMFCSDESAKWLRVQLEKEGIPPDLVDIILEVLHLGLPIDHQHFTAILRPLTHPPRIVMPPEVVDLSNFVEVDHLYVEDGGCDVHMHPKGVLRFVAKTITNKKTTRY